MRDADVETYDLVYGEFVCAGQRVVRIEDPECESAWIRSDSAVPIEE